MSPTAAGLTDAGISIFGTWGASAWTKALKTGGVIAEGVGALEIGSANNPFIKYASKAKPLEGVFDVVSHGNPNELINIAANGSRTGISAKEAAALILSHPDYVRGMPVRLVACDTGKVATGLAMQLSMELQAAVLAPNKWVFATHKGELSVFGAVRDALGRAIKNKADPGEWIWFGENFLKG